jgi:uncharacterized protein with NRDE domain
MVIAVHQHPLYPLIIATNRDEFRARSCRPSAWWTDDDDDQHHPNLLAGKDLKESGTWLGITKHGRIACITNYRDMKNDKVERSDAPSRGRLVIQYLVDEDNTSPHEFIQRFLGPNDATRYNGFNLLLGQLSPSTEELYWCSNIIGSTSEPKIPLQQHLDPGIHVISNAHLNTPWPKSERLRNHIYQIVHYNAEMASANSHNVDNKTSSSSAVQELVERLFQALQDPEPAKHDDDLPDTGIGLEWERLLSPIFVNTPTYGTICSTVILLDTQHQLRWEERSYDETGTVSTSAVYEFPLADSA